MKKSSVLIFLSLCLFLLSSCSKDREKDLEGISYDRKTDSYAIEENAVIKIAVKNENYGEAILDLWNQIHPDYPDTLSYEVVYDYSARNYLVNDDFDLLYISEEQIPLLLNTTQEIDNRIREDVTLYQLEDRDSILNRKGTWFIPMEYSGCYFAYNRTLLENAGLDLTDSDKDFLPDCIDSFEKIFEMKIESEDSSIFCIYPFTFEDRYMFYPFLTAGGWQMFSSLKANRPGFDSEEFAETLNFIQKAGTYLWYPNTQLTASDLPYAFDEAVIENTTLMTQINSYMFYKEAEEKGNDYVFTHFPSWNDNILTPLTERIGYSINKNTRYPSACMELLRILCSKEGLQSYYDNTSTISCLRTDGEIEMEDDDRKEMIQAAFYSVSEPLIALKNDSTIRAFDMYYEIDWISVVKNLFDQTISVEEAQKQIMDLADAWLMEHNEELYVEVNDAEQ